MKKKIAFIAAAVLLLMLAGCGAAKPEAPKPEVPNAEVQMVYNVDQLLAAIGSDAKICMAPGTYHLEDAATYGKPTGSFFYRWTDWGDSCGLEISGVTGMEITAQDPSNTSIVTNAYWSDVLAFSECKDISLSGITSGHSGGAGGCSGDVIGIRNCENIRLNDMHLFGCGVNGVDIDSSTGVQLVSSEIYECSSFGVNVMSSGEITVENCVFHDLGRTTDFNANGAVSLYDTKNAAVTGCTIRDNTMDMVLNVWESSGVFFADNTVSANDLRSVFNGETATVSGNSFADNNMGMWYSAISADVVDENGNPITEEMWRKLYPDSVSEHHSEVGEADVNPVSTGAQKVVWVRTADEFLAAIAPDTTIVVQSELISLWEASDYGTGANQYYYWREETDGPELVICNVDNMSILGQEDSPSTHTISAAPRYADVLAFENCTAITVAGLTVGHTVEPGYCSGGVLYFENCWDTLVNSCNLYGCGTLGVIGWNSDGMQIKNCRIYECSYGGMELYSCSGIDIGGCDFWDLGGPAYNMNNCINLTIDGMLMAGTYYGD